MKLCLDSSTIVDLLRGRRSEVRARYDASQRSLAEIVVSSIAVFELTYGLEKVSAGPKRRLELAAWLDGVGVFDVDTSDAVRSAALRHELGAVGRAIGAPDILIGGQALARGWTVVTSNVRHFGRMNGLSLIDWRASDARLTPEEIASRLAKEDDHA